MTTTLDLNTWTHPGTGEVRLYVNNLAEVIGLDVSFYKTGNVSSAALDGERISNSKAAQLLGVKVWLLDGEDGPQVGERGVRVFVKNLASNAPITAAEIAEKVRAAL